MLFLVGDTNADVSDGSYIFVNHVMQFCSDNGLIFFSKLHLPATLTLNKIINSTLLFLPPFS